MNTYELEELLACLDTGERKLLYYFKDRYATNLLASAVRPTRDGVAVGRLKRSPFAKLLARPAVAELIRQRSGAPVTSEVLQSYWPTDPAAVRAYRLTLGKWGGGKYARWDQTTRGGCNLVLQLNFSKRHMEPFLNLKNADDAWRWNPFVCYGHPVSVREQTLAWARLDVDLASGTVLIEEIQNDWIRFLREHHEYVLRQRAVTASASQERTRHRTRRYSEAYVAALGEYVDALAPHARLWSEAMLSAAIAFARDTLGCARILYHTFEHGIRLKRIDGTPPPRSLYTTLPRRFCFRETADVPGFILSQRRVRKLHRQKPLRFFELPQVALA